MEDSRLHCQQNTSMDLFIPEPMTLIGCRSRELKHSPVLAQSHVGETSRDVHPSGGDVQRASRRQNHR
jgi:hypothetical protein